MRLPSHGIVASPLLTDLLERLEQIRDGESHPAALNGSSAKRWEDDEFIYLDVVLPGKPGPTIDICIHEGRAFVRMERPPEPAEVPVVMDRATRTR